MGLDFLRNHGACRVRDDDPHPLLLDDGATLTDPEDEGVDRTYEVPEADWRPRDTGRAAADADWSYRPRCFVDGKDVGRMVAWLQSREGYPVPVRLSEIGAAVVREENGILTREFALVERVVSLMGDLFPWEEVEQFAIALQEREFRLLLSQPPKDGWSYDFERMRKTTQNRSNDEMIRLEGQALARISSLPTLIDGRLEPRAGAFDDERSPVAGLIKSHSRNYLHPEGWRAYYALRPGERTPAFRLQGRNLTVVSWYVRLDGAQREMPNWGVVRLEIAEPFFTGQLGGDWTHLDRLSHLVCEYRCRDSDYGRAPVSIYPVQRTEEKLGALFTQSDSLINHFYRLTGL